MLTNALKSGKIKYLLSNSEGKIKVVSTLVRSEFVIVESVRTEMMNESAECESVVPAG